MEAGIETVVERVLGGNIDAYAEIIETCQEDVWKVVAVMLRDTAATEDLVQQVFINAYFHLSKFDRTKDFGIWLRTIARNLVRRELRRSVRENKKLKLYHQHLLEVLEKTPDQDLRRASLREALDKCRETLEPHASQAIELRYVQALSFDKVAAALDRTVAAARQLLARVRISLRKCAEERMAKS